MNEKSLTKMFLFSQSNDLNTNIASIHEEKKPVGHHYLFNKKENETVALQHISYCRDVGA